MLGELVRNDFSVESTACGGLGGTGCLSHLGRGGTSIQRELSTKKPYEPLVGLFASLLVIWGNASPTC